MLSEMVTLLRELSDEELEGELKRLRRLSRIKAKKEALKDTLKAASA